MRRRDGGRRRFPEPEPEPASGPELKPVLGPAVALTGVEAKFGFESEAEGAGGAGAAGTGVGVAARDGLDLTLARSIQGFSGGTRGTVYWATAETDMSHCFGTQTPTRTRQAATRRLALQWQGRSEEVSGKTWGGVRLRDEALTDHTSLHACMYAGARGGRGGGEQRKGQRDVMNGRPGPRINGRDSRLISRLWYIAKRKTKDPETRAPTGVYHRKAQRKKKAAG